MEPERDIMTNEEDSNGKQLLELSNHILSERILPKLSAVEFFMFSGVCNSWKKFADEQKQYFMENQLPLVVLRPKYDEESWYFYNIFDGRLFKKTLPSLARKVCKDVSCGYMSMEDECTCKRCCFGFKITCPSECTQLWLVNPLTGEEHHVPLPPQIYNHVILTRSMPDQQLTILTFCRRRTRFQLYGYNDRKWTTFSMADYNTKQIEDIAVFKGRVYCVTYTAQIGILHLGSQIRVKIIGGYQGNVDVTIVGSLHLVASGEELLLVHSEPQVLFKVYKLEMSSMKWEKMESLGDRSLFMDNLTGCHALRTPNNMRRNMVKRNCIHYMNSTIGTLFIYSLDNNSSEAFAFNAETLNQNRLRAQHFWYFPHQSFDVDSISFVDP